MKASEIFEDAVQSSWLSDISYNAETSEVRMSLSNGLAYNINNIPQELFDKWLAAPSKGNFFKTNIEGNFVIKRADNETNQVEPEETEEQG
jgi:frataxin-like iron-binding protein CyaY